MKLMIALISVLITVSAAMGAETAAESPEERSGKLYFSGLHVDGNDIRLKAALVPAPAGGKLDFVFTGPQEYVQTVRGKSFPETIYILVDTSSVCGLHKMDQKISQMLPKLRETLHADSHVSLLSFSSEGREILLDRIRVGDLRDVDLRCHKSARSVSFEVPLQQLFDRERTEDQAVSVWVYSSGNVALSDKTIAEIKSRNVTVTVGLFEPLVMEAIQSNLEEIEKKLVDKFRHNVIGEGELVPERSLTLSFSTPYRLAGSHVQLKVKSIVTGKTGKNLANATLRVFLPMTFWARVFSFFDGWVRYAAVFLVFLMIGTGVYLIYKPKLCRVCGKKKSFTDLVCAFCLLESPAFLLARKRSASKTDFQAVPLHVKRVPFRIITEGKASGNPVFRLKQGQSTTTQLPTWVNGKKLVGERCLADGDLITTSDQAFRFCVGRRT